MKRNSWTSGSLPILLAAALGLSLGACGDDEEAAAPAPAAPAPKAAAKKPEAKEAKPAGAEAETAAAAEPAPAEEYSYSPIGKRDPFRSFIEEQAPAVAVPTVDPSCGPLCTWELDQLRLVAVVSGVASPVAMLEDPQGRGHMVRRGMSIGKRSGKVSDIRRDRLIVTEVLRGPKGEVIPTKTEVMLRGKGASKETQIVDLTPQNAQDQE